MDEYKPQPPPILISARSVYLSFATWTVGLGLLLMLAPTSWYGPSWHYFPQLPPNGFGMGICCVALGASQIVVVWRQMSTLILSVLFFLSGFVFWTAGIILGAEGLLGHMGLMEAPFMLYVGAHKFAHSAALLTHRRQVEHT
jgi:hypothetical protein